MEHRLVARLRRHLSTSLRGVEPDVRWGCVGTLLGPEGAGMSPDLGPVFGPVLSDRSDRMNRLVDGVGAGARTGPPVA